MIQPKPCYGIGAEALIDMWIERERLLRKEDWRIRDSLYTCRREAQEALGLVHKPTIIHEPKNT